MALLDIVSAGATDYSCTLRIVDSSDGTPETGVAFNTSGIDLWYRRPGGAHTSITEATQTEGGAHTDGGFVHISDGEYRLDLPDAAVAAGVDYVDVGGTVTGMVVIGGRIRIASATRGLAGTALPNAAADAAGGLPVSDAGGLDLDALDASVAAIESDTSTDGVAISTSTINGIADQVWDEAASDHISAGSFGAANAVIRSATAQAGSGTTITLDASASATDDFYNNCYVYILSGTGALQGRFITDYNGTTKVATVDTWATNPSSDSVFVVTPFGTLPGASAPTASQVADAVWDEAAADHVTSGTFGQALGGSILRTGTAQAGGASTITLDASASATNDLYNYNVIRIISGTGAGQSRQISDYVGSSKVATVSLAWTTQPASDSVFQVIDLGVDAATVASIADGVWDEARAGHVTAGTFGERVNSNVTQVSGDTTAADNLESYCDGTTPIPANVTQVSGDGTAADNLESYCDGTTPIPANATQISGDGTAADNLEAALDGTGGVTINAGLTGDVTGNLSGSVGSVTGGLNTGAGTITTLDGLDTAQDAQHATTQSSVSDVETDTQNIQSRLPASLNNGAIQADVQRINDVAITGDGGASPFDVA